MSEQSSSDEIVNRLTQRATGYKPKLPPKLAQLLPFKMQIKELRARHAAYDDIRLILAEEKIIVSLNAIYRFCRHLKKLGRHCGNSGSVFPARGRGASRDHASPIQKAFNQKLCKNNSMPSSPPRAA